MRNHELERAIAEAPDELDALAVYSDWLLEQGDPHGALIALHLRRHATGAEPPPPKLLDLIEEARLTPLVFGDLKHFRPPIAYFTVRFAFLDELTISGGGAHAGEVLRTILTHRTAPFLRCLDVETAPRVGSRWTHPSPERRDGRATAKSVWSTLCHVGLPRTVRRATLPAPVGGDVGVAMNVLTGVEELTWPLDSAALLEAHRGQLQALRALTLTTARIERVNGSRVQALVDALAVAPGLVQLPELTVASHGVLNADERAELIAIHPRLRLGIL